MFCTIEPPKNIIFIKELYTFTTSSSKPQEQLIKIEPLNTLDVVTEIKKKDKDSLSDENLFEILITPIDDGEDIDVPLISSNQLGLLKKPSAGTLKNSEFKRFLYISILI